MNNEPKPHPLRAPWVCQPSGVITDCNGRVVTVLTLGHDGCDDARGRVIASQDGTGSEPSDKLAPIDQQMPEIAQALHLLAEIEARPEFPSTLGGGQ